MKKITSFLYLLFFTALTACSQSSSKPAEQPSTANNQIGKVVKSEAEWKKILSPEAYEVLRQKGTERAFTGKYWDHKEKGAYTCGGCGLELFASNTKFESGSGWPSFWQPISKEVVHLETDVSFGMSRTEVLCAKCGGHLGHVFDDGPKPTGLRYCINSVSLGFKNK